MAAHNHLSCSSVVTILLFAVLPTEAAAGLTCLKCDSVSKPSACKYIDRCGPHEVCSIDSYVTPIGSIIYTQGCRDSAMCSKQKKRNTEYLDRYNRSNNDANVPICTECCSGDLCNAAGCGESGFPGNLGPICFSCDAYIGASMCNEIEQCSRDQICDISRLLVEGSNQDWYKSECKHTTTCAAEQNANGAHGQYCNGCCNTTVCNDNVPTHCGSTRAPTLPPQPITTTVNNQHPHYLVHIGDVHQCSHDVIKTAHHLLLIQYGDSCYVPVRAQMSWAHAERFCNRANGHLFHISNADEQKYFQTALFNHFNYPVWTGLHDRKHEQHYEWVSGEPVTYYNWMSGRGDEYGPHSYTDCVIFIPSLGGVWTDIACGIDNSTVEDIGTHNAFMCQYPTIHHGSSLTTASSVSHVISLLMDGDIRMNLNRTTVLPQGTGKRSHITPVLKINNHATIHHGSSLTTVYPVSYGNRHLCRAWLWTAGGILAQHESSCYHLPSHNNTWSNAESDCNKRKGHLFHLNNRDDQYYVHRLLHANHQYSVWTGLHDSAHEKQFVWASGGTANITDWTHVHHNGDANDCVVFDPDVHHSENLKAMPCDRNLPYICQYDLGHVPDTLIG